MEKRLPVPNGDLHIDGLAERLSEIFGTRLKASGPQSPGIDRRTQVYVLTPEDGGTLTVSVRNYASDPSLQRREVGIAVRGDSRSEDLLTQNSGLLEAYFKGL